ncbi:MAG: DEAD/DEAH box helicase [Bacteroidota bacterium]
MSSFNTLGLSEQPLKGVRAAGYTQPTPIQEAAIPIACSGRDLIGCAQTGTGKTAAFVLPILHHLTTTEPETGYPIRALVVAPTRELAQQVEDAVHTYGRHTDLYSLAIYGGVSLRPQIDELRRGVDIVVATPGRLLDLMERGHVHLDQVEVLVLDEADRMFDMGFLRDIKRIVAATPRNRQTLLFSATMPKAIRDLTRSIQVDPAYIEIGRVTTPAETVTQQVCHVHPHAKMALLYHVLEQEPTEHVIVFSRTKRRADRIKKRLIREGFSATVMHSDRSQRQRERALEGLRDGTYQILVATDIAARGIDVEGVSHVINFDTPSQAEDYIHRIGRTGRAEASGEAITFVSREEETYLRDIERHTGHALERKVYAGFDADKAPEASHGHRKAAPTQKAGSGRRSSRRSGRRR